MGLLDLFARIRPCPSCGAPRARVVLWIVRCPNHLCARFDPVYKDELALEELQPRDREAERAPEPAAQPAEPPRGDFEPDRFRLEVGYTNHRGEKKRFVTDARTVRRRGRHVSMRVAPTGMRIALDPERIDNRDDVERALGDHPEPGPTERQILCYHAAHNSTSDRHREVRARYPHWDPEVVGHGELT